MMTLNHGLSGLVTQRLLHPALKRYSPLSSKAMGWAFFLGAMLPDADIISRLESRRTYFSGVWYGHRELSHSLLGTLLLGLIAAALSYLPLCGNIRWRAFIPWLGGNRNAEGTKAAAPLYELNWRTDRFLWLAGCYWAGGLLHILGDLFTPGMKMPVFWPLEVSFGGWAHIGWFSSYLLWIFVGALVLEMGALGIARWSPTARRNLPLVVWVIYTIAVFRWVDFLVGSRYTSNEQWHAYHETLLPDAMIYPLNQGVSFLWRLFVY